MLGTDGPRRVDTWSPKTPHYDKGYFSYMYVGASVAGGEGNWGFGGGGWMPSKRKFQKVVAKG